MAKIIDVMSAWSNWMLRGKAEAERTIERLRQECINKDRWAQKGWDRAGLLQTELVAIADALRDGLASWTPERFGPSCMVDVNSLTEEERLEEIRFERRVARDAIHRALERLIPIEDDLGDEDEEDERAG